MRHWREILAGGLCLLLAGCRGPAVSPESEGPDSNRYTPPVSVTDALLRWRRVRIPARKRFPMWSFIP